MDLWIGLATLAAIVIMAVGFIWLGRGTRPDNDRNNARGGGPNWKTWK